MYICYVDESGGFEAPNQGDLHRWMQVIGHDGRLQHSI